MGTCFFIFRGSIVIAMICDRLDGKSVFLSMAQLLLEEHDLEFSRHIIYILHLALLTSRPLFELREHLNQPSTATSRQLFASLFKAWYVVFPDLRHLMSQHALNNLQVLLRSFDSRSVSIRSFIWARHFAHIQNVRSAYAYDSLKHSSF